MDTLNSLRCIGENGAAELTAIGVGDPLVCLFFKLVRDLPLEQLDSLWQDAVAGADAGRMADLTVLAFQTRATRNMGKGEKRLFYHMMLRLPREALLSTLPLAPHYGYYKDWFMLLDLIADTGKGSDSVKDMVTERIVDLVTERLGGDERELTEATTEGRTPQLSLCAKWCPREGSYFDKKLAIVPMLAARLFPGASKASSLRRYRLLLSRLNRALLTTEVLCAAGRWSEIEFGRVSSVCLMRLRKAFLNERLDKKLKPHEELTGNRHPEDSERVAARAHLRAVLQTRGRVKGKALQPHEFVGKCTANPSQAEAELLHGQWEAMRSSVAEAMDAARAAARANVLAAVAPGSSSLELSTLAAALPKSIDLGRLVPLVDVSGSMTGRPMEAAIGLGILVSELTHPAFRDRVLTFESTPRWFELDGSAMIAKKVAKLRRAPWGGSTNFAAACELLLTAAMHAKLKPDEVPDLIVFSDMQFDAAGDGRPWETHFERLQRRFAEVGRSVCGQPYSPPRIIFWNLRGSTVGFPAAANQPNTQMISGFSPALFKLVLTGADIFVEEQEPTEVGEGPTPEQTVRAALDDAVFDPIRLALMETNAGIFAGYAFTSTAQPAEEDFEAI